MPALVAMRVPRASLPRLDPVPLPARPSPHRSGQGHDAAQSPRAPPNLAADVPALPASRHGAFLRHRARDATTGSSGNSARQERAPSLR